MPKSIRSVKLGGWVDLKDVAYKLGYIFLPLLLLAAAFVILYSGANWLLFSDSGLVPLDRDLTDFWLPGALGFGLVGLLIWPRLRVLRLGERNGPFFYLIAAAIVVIAPACFAQHYVTTANGALTKVATASAIPLGPHTKYYAPDAVCLDRGKPLVQHANEISGRQNQFLDFNLYVLVPVCGTAQHPAWIGFKYTSTTDNHASEAVKEAKYRDFLSSAQGQFDAFDPARILYLETVGHTKDRRAFEKALSTKDAADVGRSLILIPHQDAFDARNGQALPNTVYAFGISAGLFLLMLLFPELDQAAVAEARKPQAERAAPEDRAWLAFVLPSREAYGLPLLIDANIAVFLAMVFSGLGVLSFQQDDLLRWGANYGPAIHGLGAYRLVSSQFVHGGIMHLASNMYGLLVGGLFLSPVMRKAGLIACYLLCGLGGAIASVVVHPAIMSVGASGAIMGLWGVLIVLALLGDKRIGAARWVIVVNGLIFAGLTLAQGLANPGIDNAAHLGGLATGAIIGGLLFAWAASRKASSVSAS